MTNNNEQAYNYIIQQDTVGLNSCNFNPRILAGHIKNNNRALMFLLNYLNNLEHCDQ